MPSAPRPLSPHLQVYRPQLTSVMSITHRATGIALAAGTLLLVYWLLAAADGPDSFAVAQALIGSWVGYLLLFGWSFALFYHLANGIRHLAWDAGYGFELDQVYASGWVVVGAAVGLTVLAWIVGLVTLGSAP
jgi:succinate dehydrogenase / fumarate reductase cytochrome b subunit